MNKGLELIEAHHLFSVDNDHLGVLVHPQSIVHGIVAFRDGNQIATMSTPNMRTPIAHCLAWPARAQSTDLGLDLVKAGKLTFERPDLDKFPALKVAREALDTGVWATNVLNAANEVAVSAFLSGAIGFLEIARLTADTIEQAAASGLDHAPATIKDALALDKEARQIANGLIAG
jgi:1-deoxy-D-xylulose-5-phosphate reductoisomerase